MQQPIPFFMFEGSAEAAMEFYVSLFGNSRIKSITRYGKEGPGKEGTVIHAVFELNGREFMAIDSAVKHAFTFTPSLSIYLPCETETEIDSAFAKLSDGGSTLMALGDHGFSRKFGWVNDRFGVSWQLNLA
jgi:predicted 3-demethylubiquinone-9 3-methyltransferase (glyoxalase superfamily)